MTVSSKRPGSVSVSLNGSFSRNFWGNRVLNVDRHHCYHCNNAKVTYTVTKVLSVPTDKTIYEKSETVA